MIKSKRSDGGGQGLSRMRLLQSSGGLRGSDYRNRGKLGREKDGFNFGVFRVSLGASTAVDSSFTSVESGKGKGLGEGEISGGGTVHIVRTEPPPLVLSVDPTFPKFAVRGSISFVFLTR